MPYGPADPQQTSSVYSVQIAYTPPAAQVPMTVTLDLAAVGDQGVTEASADAAFQALLDLVEGSSDFAILFGGGLKRYPVTSRSPRARDQAEDRICLTSSAL